MKYSDFFLSKTVIAVSISLAAINDAFREYFFQDWQFAYYLAILILIDTILGLWRNLKSRTISSRGFARFFEKVALYFIVLILTHVLTHFRIEGEPVRLLGWIDDSFFVAMIIREAISILENIAVIYPELIPNSLLNKLKEHLGK